MNDHDRELHSDEENNQELPQNLQSELAIHIGKWFFKLGFALTFIALVFTHPFSQWAWAWAIEHTLQAFLIVLLVFSIFASLIILSATYLAGRADQRGMTDRPLQQDLPDDTDDEQGEE